MTAKTAATKPAKTPKADTQQAAKIDGAAVQSDAAAEMVPLNLLFPSPKNVRRYQSQRGRTEMKASLLAHGLLQNLNATKISAKRYEVTAGARRLGALKELAAEGAIAAAYLVRCNVKAKGSTVSDTEISLAENMVREQMNAADEIEAFGKLAAEEGLTPEQIADRFGLSHMTVRRRLKLSTLSPRVIEGLREGAVTLQQAEALSLIDDHAEQDGAFFDVPNWQREPNHIRQVATAEQVAASNRFAKFVGLDAYKAAGGAITADLFATDENAVFLTDKPLLMRLAVAKVQTEADAVREAEGWKWAEGSLEPNALNNWPINRRLRPVTVELSPEDQTRFDTLTARAEELSALFDDMEDDAPEYEALSNEYDEVDADLDALAEKRSAFAEADRARAGVIVTIDHSGELQIGRGYVREEDQQQAPAHQTTTGQGAALAAASTPAADSVSEEDEGPALSAAVIEDLSKVRTAALAVTVAARPDVALACAVHALASSLFYRSSYNSTAVEFTARPPTLEQTQSDAANAGAFDDLARAVEKWQLALPHCQSELWAWCIDAKREELLALLAQCVAMSLNAVSPRQEPTSSNNRRLNHADQIAQAVALNMGRFWSPSDAFLTRVPKAVTLAALKENNASPSLISSLAKAPKAEIVAAAKKPLADWLPQPLRAVPVEIEDDPDAASALYDADAEGQSEADDLTDEDSAPEVVAVYPPHMAPIFQGVPNCRESTEAERIALEQAADDTPSAHA